jgi:hypothetical protein
MTIEEIREYFVHRAAENKTRAGVLNYMAPQEQWFSAKAQTYLQCAAKLLEVTPETKIVYVVEHQ